MRDSPNFYAILPANIRYAKDLTEFQKLLFAEITALSDKHGYCWANNRYFANLYEKDSTWISKAIKDLSKKGYIDIEQFKEEGNTRKIFIGELKKLKKNIVDPLAVKCKTYGTKVQDPSCSKVQDPLAVKCKHNNTSIILQEGVEGKEEKKDPPPPPPKNIDYMNGMRDVEVRGNFLLQKWNHITGRQDIMNSDIKKGMYDIMKSTSSKDFEERCQKYIDTVKIIEDKKLRNYIYYPIWEYDFGQFLSKINYFYGEAPLILGKLAKVESKKKVIAEVSRKQEIIAEEPKKHVVDEATRQANNEKLKQQMTTWRQKINVSG